MKPLYVLFGAFLSCVFLTSAFQRKINYVFSGNAAMGFMLLFTSIGHFMFSKGMAMMMPDFIPYKIELIYLTGVLEIALGVSLFIPSLRKLGGWITVLFFLLILPANINAALTHVNYETATYDGPGTEYLWFRAPLQLFFIAWVYYFSIKVSLRKETIEE